MLRTIKSIAANEEGHAGPLPGMLAGVVGAVLLGIGAAADDMGWLAVVGGVVLAVGIGAMSLMNHIFVEYDFYARLDKLEGK